MRTLLCAVVVSLSASAAPTVQRLSLVTSAGPIGTAVATTNGNTVDIDWRVDDNGRGAKLKEHLELGKDRLPVRWDIEGKGWVGAPVKESFKVEAGKASWKSLDDEGSADASGALYFPNNSSPFTYALLLEQLLKAKGNERSVLPAGRLRLQKLSDVPLTADKAADKATAYALWGMDTTPSLLLAAKGRYVGSISPGWVLIEEKYASAFPHLSKLAGELSAQLLAALTAKVAHPIEGPLWISHVRVFDPTTGKSSEPQQVVVFADRVVGVRTDAPPPGVKVVDGTGGTLLPGLFDSHAHQSDWSGPLNIASGVTLGRDPGNDNDTLLALERRIESGELVGQRIVKSGFLEGQSPFSAHDGFVIGTLEQGLEKVRWYADHGYWGLKIYNSMNPDFVAPLAKEAHRLGMHVSGHVPAFMTSERAVRDGYDEINHINQLLLSFVITEKEDTRTPFRFTALGERVGKLDLKAEPFQRMLKLMKERHIALDPTMATFSVLLQTRPGKACPTDATWLSHAPVMVQRGRKTALLDVKPEQDPLYEASWKKMEEVLLLLHKEGIVLVPGTDDVPGLVLHSELEAWVKAGIPASAVLTAATLGGARFVGREASLGSIAPGKLADLYLVDGDPTQDISAVRKGRLVVTRGRYYYPDEVLTAVGVEPFAARAEVKAP